MTASDISDKHRFLAQGNVYLPHIMIIEKIIEETPGVKTFHFNFKDEQIRDEFTFESGQFGEYSVFGVGEAPFCISSSPTRGDHLEFTLQRVGKVTNALHRLGVGAEIGFRGPYGNSFPIDLLQGKNLIFVGGGIGLAPLRSLIWNVLDNRDKYGDVQIIYGARSPADLCFRYDLDAWGDDKTVDVITTVDRQESRVQSPVSRVEAGNSRLQSQESRVGAGDSRLQTADSRLLREGFVPQVLEQVAPSAENAMAIVCGPPIMIRFTFPVLGKLGFTPEQMITTLEKRMKCGIGKCGRCNIGDIYVCRDGPVFTYAQIKRFISSEH
ncbi:MAG: Anaerobic sulfite reductase subunit B [Chloroflexi bacterium]|nr:Anaerobic sulfite reductase subunit B [Chloroflexota bacterium]